MRPHWKELDKQVEFLNRNKHLVRLNRNENTDIIYNQKLSELLSNIDLNTTYTYPDYNNLYYKLSNFLAISEDQILLTNGCDGALKQIFEYYRDHNIIMYHKQTYSGAICYERMYSNNNSNKTLCYICNPNNPTGVMISNEEISKCADMYDFVVVDETYYDFVKHTSIPLLDTHSNLAITRSFSKAWGLAGYRIGLLISSVDNINQYMSYRPSAPVSNIGCQLIDKLIDNYHYVESTAKRITEGTRYLNNIFQHRGWEHYDTSSMNFVNVRLPLEEIKRLSKYWYFKHTLEGWCVITTQPIQQINHVY